MTIADIRNQIRSLLHPDFAYKYLTTQSFSFPPFHQVPLDIHYTLSLDDSDRDQRSLKAIYLLEGFFPQRVKIKRIPVVLRFRENFVIYVYHSSPNALSFFGLGRFFPRTVPTYYDFPYVSSFPLENSSFSWGLHSYFRAFSWSSKVNCTWTFSHALLFLKTSFLD